MMEFSIDVGVLYLLSWTRGTISLSTFDGKSARPWVYALPSEVGSSFPLPVLSPDASICCSASKIPVSAELTSTEVVLDLCSWLGSSAEALRSAAAILEAVEIEDRQIYVGIDRVRVRVRD